MEESMEVGTRSLPPFLTKCYDMVDDPATDSIVSWSPTNYNFIIWDMTSFSKDLLPKYFKHSNFPSFMRQLNIYGFKKADPDRWEFANEGFIKGKRHFMKNISRRKHTQGLVEQKQSQQKNASARACVEVGKIGLHEEVENLKRDKNVLMQELVKLRQHQQTADTNLHCLKQRLQGMEKHQQQMLSFLVIVMQSPGLLLQLLQQNENNWRKTETTKKRRLLMLEEGTEDGEPVASDGQIVRYQPPMDETPKSVSVPVSNADISPEFDLSPNETNDFMMNVDILSFPVEKILLSSENDGPLIFPDLPDDDILEQLLQAFPLLDDIEEIESDDPAPMDTETELELNVHNTQLETSPNLDLLTEQTGHLASETDN